ncbi:hypothetical protein, unlikely [Trypanosoma brucei gambiense DAL972]|uniref:Uncharacterized protein n=1 Tax=Trypanosoma brucei gambiense (strain MHOM/CI/86/DAL972) TaxID=679716 RepID=D0A0H1_TRYB9|nr:hypothetical protein, unlikely [Trypanosoma brucei gambiense DAL972]CBH16729.1 hypothetical protein, unlikely [Trypanosoma brucei gambiense DAL972]|eukprot:XP_011778993.1 hypothetical protein, unlikely [Trypanosoma brucei gambiense DAL972]
MYVYAFHYLVVVRCGCRKSEYIHSPVQKVKEGRWIVFFFFFFLLSFFPFFPFLLSFFSPFFSYFRTPHFTPILWVCFFFSVWMESGDSPPCEVKVLRCRQPYHIIFHLIIFLFHGLPREPVFHVLCFFFVSLLFISLNSLLPIYFLITHTGLLFAVVVVDYSRAATQFFFFFFRRRISI